MVRPKIRIRPYSLRVDVFAAGPRRECGCDCGWVIAPTGLPRCGSTTSDPVVAGTSAGTSGAAGAGGASAIVIAPTTCDSFGVTGVVATGTAPGVVAASRARAL